MDNRVADAISQINAEAHQSADTHLFKLPLPPLAGIDIYLKDEDSGDRYLDSYYNPDWVRDHICDYKKYTEH